MIKTVATLSALLLALAGSADGCKPREVKSDRPEANRKVDPRKKRTVIIKAQSDEVPWTIDIVVYGPDGKDEYDEIVTRRNFRTTVDYTSGISLRIYVTVRGPKPGYRTSCNIIDGLSNVIADNSSGHRAACRLTTKR